MNSLPCNSFFNHQLVNFPFPENIQSILETSLQAVDPLSIVERSVRTAPGKIIVYKIVYDLKTPQKIKIIALGKASQRMAMGIKQVLSEYDLTGIAIAKNEDLQLTNSLIPEIKTILGGHPIPSEKSIQAADKLIEFSKNSHGDDLVFCLISGGASALVTKPIEGISLYEIQALTSELLSCGADIREINTIRKHLDLLKGGGLAKLISPATLITLILSDVVGDPLSMIASGPTLPDETTYLDALNIIKKYGIRQSIGKNIYEHLLSGYKGAVEETLKLDDYRTKNKFVELIGNNHIAAEAARKKAIDLGFNGQIISDQMVGDTKVLAKEIGNLIKTHKSNIDGPSCYIGGGEATVKIQGKGKGGRNQEVALACAIEIDGMDNVCVVTMATDGEDGPTDAAGAVVTGHTIEIGKSHGLDAIQYLQNNDSYNYFSKINALVKTGLTGTNVNDLTFIFIA
jgi:glycerate 2-kinase